MPRFFIAEQQLLDGTATLYGEDAHHIARSLRMAVGETVTLCDGRAEYECELVSFEDDRKVLARVISERPCETEPPFDVTLYQALPKGDKLEHVIQKAVECGVSAIVPFESEHCVVRVRPDAEERKTERRARIALEAAKQCGRGCLPTVAPTVSFDEMLRLAADADAVLFCYEGEGTVPLGELIRAKRADGTLSGERPRIAIVVGSEGGFSPKEARRAAEQGFLMTGLGHRILRTETASGFVLSCLVYEFELSSICP